MFAQSVGGGGGWGGMAVSAALGGSKSKNISIALGGSAGGGGKGGDVKVTSTDLVVTEGDDAIAHLRPERGRRRRGRRRGGRPGGVRRRVDQPGDEHRRLRRRGLEGGDVTVVNSGDVFTSGEQSHGIFAESIGGGGGHGGMAGIDENQWSDYMAGGAGTVSLGSNSNNISVALGGQGGTGDDGGVVKVTNSGVVATTGEIPGQRHLRPEHRRRRRRRGRGHGGVRAASARARTAPTPSPWAASAARPATAAWSR